MNRKAILGGAVALASAVGIGVGLVAVGGGSAAMGYGSGSPGTGTGTTTTVATASTGLGKVLTDGSGRVVYLFEDDPPGRSNCANACASVWPPLTTTTAPLSGAGANSAQLSTLRRDDGTTQVVYDGHPLYLYVGDKTAGSVNGQGLDQFGAKWYVLSPSGQKIDND